MSVCCMVVWIVLIVLLLATDVFCPLFALMGSRCDGHNTPRNNNEVPSSTGAGSGGANATGNGTMFGLSEDWLNG